jgi:hypothetical protein
VHADWAAARGLQRQGFGALRKFMAAPRWKTRVGGEKGKGLAAARGGLTPRSQSAHTHARTEVTGAPGADAAPPPPRAGKLEQASAMGGLCWSAQDALHEHGPSRRIPDRKVQGQEFGSSGGDSLALPGRSTWAVAGSERARALAGQAAAPGASASRGLSDICWIDPIASHLIALPVASQKAALGRLK